ncbi:DUF4328 domain-containing protein [Rhodococcus triatomae]|uniref:Uncharacterized protein n=1 Tax=Rhodococcus triatomae TaxID=300028 RepID=A0A1G8HUH3_9NOCA|nr:DUF4328 domain-containing protein [Rhodococcus triatomae]QNG20883.1 DUF4328 domain-containing protein [Rhodococcus triatomae]QNG23202.1 DUF4328 domain-containing protein [Rhodococcus triatomae]SDI10345.1 protein of unknown function [Rhodococcus triatomae]
MINIQVCARCATRWQNQGRPMQWCPKCHGVLLAPFRADRPQGRSFRWIARPPSLRAKPRGTGSRGPSPTPRYTEIPRWGLQDHVAAAPARRDWAAAAAENAAVFALWTAGAYLLAAVAELARYGILVRNRTRLVDPMLLAASDAAVIVAGAAGVLLAVATGVCCVCWLLRARRRTFAAEGVRDPRSTGAVVLGCAVPGLNLVMPAVYLLEIVRRDPRALLLVRVWWATWVLGGLLLVVNWVWRFRTSLQAMADGVLLAAFTALVAAATATVTAAMIHRIERRTWRGSEARPTRWVQAPPGVREAVTETSGEDTASSGEDTASSGEDTAAGGEDTAAGGEDTAAGGDARSRDGAAA